MTVHDRYAWPADFVARMRSWLGPEATDFLAALGKRDYGLRLNPQRGPLARIQAALPWQTAAVPWCPEGLWLGAEALQDEVPLGSHPYHATGAYYVQDPSAMAAAILLNPQPGEWVLDLAAAPGSKASHIGARMDGEGVLVANDVARGRTTVLAMNLERMGVTNAMVTNATPDRLAEQWPGLFDAMLVDAPCSGEGTFSRDAQALRDWSLDAVRGYAVRQLRILTQAAPLVRPGGQILYGTCTFSPEENEGVIADFLKTQPEYEMIDLPALPGMSHGRPDWIGAPAVLDKAGRFWPHLGPGHGHFYALLRRRGEPPKDLPARWSETRMPGRVLRLYEAALGQILRDEPPLEGLVLMKNDQCYVTPMAPERWGKLPVMRPGWWIASLRHDKIFLDHALAMALGPQAVRAHVRLTPDDARLDTFLTGGAWPDTGSAGYVLVTVDAYPLGWGKRGAGKLRSRYPVHLRRARAG
jgi:16S rRNA C967 or C1407 C5-methylase (RsmB/RsmF family)/NOL1/NOP2/fmu family ribosome biogenesis protein